MLMMPARRARDPAGISAGVIFLLPNRQARLVFIDDIATGAETVLAVGRNDTDPHRHVADLKPAGAVNAFGRDHVEFFHDFPEYILRLTLTKGRVSLVFQRDNRHAVVMVTHAPFKAIERAGLWRDQARAQVHLFQWFFG